MTIFLRRPQVPRTGFTLIEMLAAMAVLILILALLVPMFSSLTSTASNSVKKLDVDLIARQALDRIGRDISQMPMRQDLDYWLNKQAGNDEFALFSRVPGVLPASGTVTDPASGLTLVGYRVTSDKDSQNMNLERLAVAQPFDALTFLTYDAAGNLVANTGITKAMATPTNYHVLCKGVLRFELGFLLKDGTYATLPMDVGKNPGSDTDVGYREWYDDGSYNFARIRVPDGPSATVFRPLGWQDVAAIVVTLAVIDPANAARATTGGLESAAGLLPDAVASTDPANPDMPGTTWKNQLETPGSLGIPQTAQNGVRVYQRAYYLDSL